MHTHGPEHGTLVQRSEHVVVIGGGLAGSEAALQLADRGHHVSLYEMRPTVASPAHHTGLFGELVCSNSLKSKDPSTAAGQLKRELARLGSHLLAIAEAAAVPAGGALAVDRDAFARRVTHALEQHPGVDLVRQEAASVPKTGNVIIATGPLSSPAIEGALSQLVGPSRLAFFDAAAPIVDAASIDTTRAYAASRYDKGQTADYLNCPMGRDEYDRFLAELVGAGRVHARDFETSDLFQACQPIEELARRGADAMRFGPLKPVGLVDPRTGERPWAVVQLRAENVARTAYNLVGFQTNLTFPEQRRVFRLIPGLENAEFLRYGVMHRNTFLDAPRLLDPTLALRSDPRIRFAGQITGTEGYVEAIATGLLSALNTAAEQVGDAPLVLPTTTALGALVAYATDPSTTNYQPMHVNWGLVPPLQARVPGRKARYEAYAERACKAMDTYLDSVGFMQQVPDAC